MEAAVKAVKGAAEAANKALAASPSGSGAQTVSPPVPTLSWGGYFQGIAWLCFILAVLWVLLWLFKKSRASVFFPGSSPDMSIESRLALGPKKWIVVARYQDKRLVLGVTDHQINLLAEYESEPDEEKPADENGIGKAFAALLKKNRQPGEAGGESLSPENGGGKACDPCKPESPNGPPGQNFSG